MCFPYSLKFWKNMNEVLSGLKIDIFSREEDNIIF